MSRALPILAAAAAAAALAGCQQPLDAPLSPTFGRAVASMDAQVIPAVPSDQPPETSGARAVAAIRRYESGQTKPVEMVSTSTISASTSSSTSTTATQSSGGDAP